MLWDKINLSGMDLKQKQELLNLTKLLNKNRSFPLKEADDRDEIKKFLAEFKEWEKNAIQQLNRFNSKELSARISFLKILIDEYSLFISFHVDMIAFVNSKTKAGTKIQETLIQKIEKSVKDAADSKAEYERKLKNIEDSIATELRTNQARVDKLKNYFNSNLYERESLILDINYAPTENMHAYDRMLCMAMVFKDITTQRKENVFMPIWLYLQYETLPSPLLIKQSFTKKEFKFVRYDKYAYPDRLEFHLYDLDSKMQVKASYLLDADEVYTKSILDEFAKKYPMMTISGIIDEVIIDSVSNIPHTAKMTVHSIKQTAEFEFIKKVNVKVVPTNIEKLFEPIDFALKNPKATKFPFHQDFVAYELSVPTKKNNYYHLKRVEEYAEDTGETIMQHGVYYPFSHTDRISETGNFAEILKNIDSFRITSEYYRNLRDYIFNNHNYIENENVKDEFIRVFTDSIILKYKIIRQPSVLIEIEAVYAKDKNEADSHATRFDWNGKTYNPTTKAVDLLNMASSLKGETYILKDWLTKNLGAKWDSVNNLYRWTPKYEPSIEYIGSTIKDELQKEREVIQDQVNNGLRPALNWTILKSNNPMALFFVFNDPPLLIGNKDISDFYIIANFNPTDYYLKFKFPYDQWKVSQFQAIRKRGIIEWDGNYWYFKLTELDQRRIDKLAPIKKDLDVVLAYIKNIINTNVIP